MRDCSLGEHVPRYRQPLGGSLAIDNRIFRRRFRRKDDDSNHHACKAQLAPGYQDVIYGGSSFNQGGVFRHLKISFPYESMPWQDGSQKPHIVDRGQSHDLSGMIPLPVVWLNKSEALWPMASMMHVPGIMAKSGK